MPTIQIGTTGELGILLAGITFGVAMTVKVIKWIQDMIDARKGTGKKYEPHTSIVEDVMSRRNPPITRTEHDNICKGVQMEFDKGFGMLREDIKTLGMERSDQVRLIFAEMKANHTEIRNMLQTQGERISSVETEVKNLKGRMNG